MTKQAFPISTSYNSMSSMTNCYRGEFPFLSQLRGVEKVADPHRVSRLTRALHTQHHETHHLHWLHINQNHQVTRQTISAEKCSV